MMQKTHLERYATKVMQKTHLERYATMWDGGSKVEKCECERTRTRRLFFSMKLHKAATHTITFHSAFHNRLRLRSVSH